MSQNQFHSEKVQLVSCLLKQDLEGLNFLHKDLYGVGESTTDLSDGIVYGRIPGGVAILWHKKYDQLVKVVRLNFDWAIGNEFSDVIRRSSFSICTHLMNVTGMKMNVFVGFLMLCLSSWKMLPLVF